MSVKHCCPAKSGAGLSQFRVRVLVPGPQVAEQAENKLQAPQFTLTEQIKNHFIIRLTQFKNVFFKEQVFGHVER
jgi:hypothetical protein